MQLKSLEPFSLIQWGSVTSGITLPATSQEGMLLPLHLRLQNQIQLEEIKFNRETTSSWNVEAIFLIEEKCLAYS